MHMCACGLIYSWTKKPIKNQHWTTRLVGYWAASSAAGHGSWAVTSLLAKPPFLDINLATLFS